MTGSDLLACTTISKSPRLQGFVQMATDVTVLVLIGRTVTVTVMVTVTRSRWVRVSLFKCPMNKTEVLTAQTTVSCDWKVFLSACNAHAHAQAKFIHAAKEPAPPDSAADEERPWHILTTHASLFHLPL